MTTTPTEETIATPTASTATATFAPPRTLSILSIVAAIASIPLGHFFILSLAAIVLGFLARSREPWARNLSTWGIVIGFVVMFWWLVVGLFALAFWVPLALVHLLH
jgi:hypothetical protein